MGNFNYSDFFPNSPRAKQLSKVIRKSIGQALDEFLIALKQRVESSTYRDYNSAVEFHLRPRFGKIQLSELSTADIRAWLASLEISNKRKNNILIPLRAVLGDAFADEILKRNPADRIRNLPNQLDEPDPFTPEEIQKILSVCCGQAANLFQFAFWTGLRTSEQIALEWGDVDWNKGVVRVRRASVRKVVKQPKTKSGEREVLLLSPALEALNGQKQFTLLRGGRVFHNPRTNKPWETDGQIRKTAWEPALRRAGVPYRNPYQTRHTYASTILSAGENPLWVAQQMGHKDWGMIRKRYGRWIPEVDRSAGQRIMERLAQIGTKNKASA
jgi:integrase